jgi:Putative metal-binding motif
MVLFFVTFPRRGSQGLALALGLAALLASATAHAHAAGIASQGCTGCHSGGAAPNVTITSSSPTISPGDTVTIAIAIPTPAVAGMYFTADVGTLAVIAGEGEKLADVGITHSTPKRAVNGVATFHVSWTAPSSPGGVNLTAYVVAGNGDGSSRGDGAGMGFEAFAFGCSGMKYYRDFDGDGYGGPLSGYTVNCTQPTFYVTVLGDCNDADERIHPGAPEICNGIDDNCNGQIDEGLPIMTYYPDHDGDGYGVPGTGVMGCKAPTGYGVGMDDCNDNDKTIYPGAPEICDGKDNNCNGEVDENARAACGTGWCRRLASSCTSNDCVPGAPRAETCNAFDDDCDGVIDNGTDAELCGPTGLTCVDGSCVKPGTKPDAGASTGAAGTGVITGAAGATGAAADTAETGEGAGVGTMTGAGGESAARPRERPGCAIAGRADAVPGGPAFAFALGAVMVVSARRRRRARSRATAADRSS